jgi:hypothetical protein
MIFGGFLVGLVPHDARSLDVTTNTRPWLEEGEFGLDPLLHATANQTVVLNLEGRGDDTGDTGDFFDPGGGWGPIRRHRFRFLVEEAQKFGFCIPQNEPSIVLLTIKENSDGLFNRGSIVVRSRPGDACEPVSLAPGSYTVDVYHDSRTIPPRGRKAFLHRPRARLFRPSQAVEGTVGGSVLPAIPDYMAFTGPNGLYVSDDTASYALASKSGGPVTSTEVWRLTSVPNTNGGHSFSDGDGYTVTVHYGDATLYGAYEGSQGYFTPWFQIYDKGNWQFNLQAAWTPLSGVTSYGWVIANGSDPLVVNADVDPSVFTVKY